MDERPVDKDQEMALKKAEEIRREIYRKMTPERKLEIAFALDREARKLKAAGLRMQHPDWSEEQIAAQVKEIFFYARS
jgi:hypothetical protein